MDYYGLLWTIIGRRGTPGLWILASRKKTGGLQGCVNAEILFFQQHAFTVETTQKSTGSGPDFWHWILCYDLLRIPVLQGHDFLVIVHLVQHYRAPTFVGWQHYYLLVLPQCIQCGIFFTSYVKFNFRFFINDAKIFTRTLRSNFAEVKQNSTCFTISATRTSFSVMLKFQPRASTDISALPKLRKVKSITHLLQCPPEVGSKHFSLEDSPNQFLYAKWSHPYTLLGPRIVADDRTSIFVYLPPLTSVSGAQLHCSPLVHQNGGPRGQSCTSQQTWRWPWTRPKLVVILSRQYPVQSKIRNIILSTV